MKSFYAVRGTESILIKARDKYDALGKCRPITGSTDLEEVGVYLENGKDILYEACTPICSLIEEGWFLWQLDPDWEY